MDVGVGDLRPWSLFFLPFFGFSPCYILIVPTDFLVWYVYTSTRSLNSCRSSEIDTLSFLSSSLSDCLPAGLSVYVLMDEWLKVASKWSNWLRVKKIETENERGKERDILTGWGVEKETFFFWFFFSLSPRCCCCCCCDSFWTFLCLQTCWLHQWRRARILLQNCRKNLLHQICLGSVFIKRLTLKTSSRYFEK